MPKDTLDEPQDMDANSSAASELDVVEAPAAEAAEVETPAESSPATDETEADTLSVVRDVVDARKEEPAEAAPSAEGEENGEGADEPPGGPDNENYSDVPFNQHPRFKHLIAERNAFRTDAGRYRNVENFLNEANLTSEEAANSMTIAGLAKTDPQAAWNQIKPWVRTLLVAAGEVLPDDLAARVQKGELTQDAALEVSRARAAQNAVGAREKFTKERGERQQQASLGRTLRDTSEGWLANRRLKDPNFAAKETRLFERIISLQSTEGKPNTADGVKAQLKKAYDFVSRESGSTTPKSATPAPRAGAPAAAAPAARRPAIRPVTGGQVAGHSSMEPAPKTTRDVIRQVVASRGSA